MTSRLEPDENEEADLLEEDDPTDPSHPDYDLSEAAPAYLDYEVKPWFTRRWFVSIVAILVITGLLLPFFLRLS